MSQKTIPYIDNLLLRERVRSNVLSIIQPKGNQMFDQNVDVMFTPLRL